jgi:hypothetical protein
MNEKNTPPGSGAKKENHKPEQKDDDDVLLPLFRLLLREPPKGHDFKTCPI